tara:strand:- start:2238 stop:2705 length:468 start_codon:yes stop_codon:yes gene_type:complete
MNKYKRIAKLVNTYTGENIFSPKKTQGVVDARGLFDHIMYIEFGCTYQSISNFYYANGKSRNHTVILYSVRQYKKEIEPRREDFKNIFYRILTTEVTHTKYKNVIKDVSKISTVKGLNSVKAFVNKTLDKELDYKYAQTEDVDQTDLDKQIKELT